MTGNFLSLFPADRREFWKMAAKTSGDLTELRLRAGQPVIVRGINKEGFLSVRGEYTSDIKEAYRADVSEITEYLRYLCKDSFYAYEDELRQGFITAEGGHRIGVTGKIVMDGERIRTVKNISGLNIRIAKQRKGVADGILPSVYRDGRVQNLLIISPPACGKTTLLRDLIRQISNGTSYGKGCNVGVVDERSEIGGCYMGVAQNDLGIRTDLLDGCPKALGMMFLLRTMSPEVIAVDEIGGQEDAAAIRQAVRCGCRVIATVHGEDLKDVKRRNGVGELLCDGIFDKYFLLYRCDERFEVREETEEQTID